jgi:prolyl-tRNA synthetase
MSSSGGGNDDGDAKKHKKKQLGMTSKKDASFGDWYSEVIVHGEMIEYYTVSGCYIMKPSAVQIWELLNAVRRRNAATSRNAGGVHRRSLECRRG